MKPGQAFPGHPIVVRSYDLGGDKFPAPFQVSFEPNPQLGQQMRWVARAELGALDFPPADAELIQQLSTGRRDSST